MTARPAHTDVAAYVVGALESAELAAFENHLRDCRGCQLELTELAELPDLLDAAAEHGVLAAFPAAEPEDAARDEECLRALLTRIRAARNRRARIAFAAAALAVAVIVLLGMRPAAAPTAPPVVTVISTPPDEPPPSATTPRTLSAKDPAGNVAATLVLTAAGAGTGVEAEVSGLPGPGPYRLVAIAADGREQAVAEWVAPDQGFAAPRRVRGTAGLPVTGIRSFEVRTGDGRCLLAIRA
ncbi:anti-sigma factor family protein [Amycolatopsis anabasis]|uniref:anti-sigma factor family protein n=1 Tax=Amycolatopsis anabasis TaxID=1840409 RepID=UPI00131ECFD1|nr:hypothetical protein [Amycolatopsis anabasis]